MKKCKHTKIERYEEYFNPKEQRKVKLTCFSCGKIKKVKVKV